MSKATAIYNSYKIEFDSIYFYLIWNNRYTKIPIIYFNQIYNYQRNANFTVYNNKSIIIARVRKNGVSYVRKSKENY